MQMLNWTPQRKAKRAAELTKADRCGERAFDDCFENGAADEVVAAFVSMCDNDAVLNAAVARNGYYINIDAWREKSRELCAPQLSLFQ